MKPVTELKQTLELLQKYNVTYYECGPLKIQMAPPVQEIVLPKAKDLSIPGKTKEQEAEELLFHSAVR